jgi:hypothetical protein
MIETPVWLALFSSYLIIILAGMAGYYGFSRSFFSLLVFQMLAIGIMVIAFPYMVEFFAG